MTALLLVVVLTASFFPCTGAVAQGFNWLAGAMVALLFFLHGARLSRAAVLAGATHWRLHLSVLLLTFVAFPLIGLALRPLCAALLTPELYLGVLFLCVLPSTVQSSIAFTSVARGNVPAAVCAASLSNFIGIFLTPVLAGAVLSAHGGAPTSAAAIWKIVLQLLLPFVAGQCARPWLAATVERHRAALKLVDQGAILLVVYVAFSAAVVQGLWRQLPLVMLLSLLAISALILAIMMGLSTYISRKSGLSPEDEIAVVFCGSKKSLASGVPMAKVLFASHAAGPVLLPLMLFHQLQLMVCAVLAQRYARRSVRPKES